MPPSLSTPAILLRATAYGESDRVVSLLGRATGRVAALARGARKSQRRFGGGLGLGAAGEATLKERPGADLMILESFDITDPRATLGGDLARTAHAAYVLELVDRLCGPRQPEPEVFDWLETFLFLLGDKGPTVQRLRVFELGLLKRLGLGLSVEACVSCGRTDLDAEGGRWHPERGGVVCRNCVRQGTLLTVDVRRALLRLQAATLAEADEQELTRDQNAGCREALLEALRVHVTTPLKSLEFISKMGGI